MAAGVFAIAAGLGEIIVGVTGNYLGILSKPLEPSAVTALVGACYSLGDAFILTSKKWAAAHLTSLQPGRPIALSDVRFWRQSGRPSRCHMKRRPVRIFLASRALVMGRNSFDAF